MEEPGQQVEQPVGQVVGGGGVTQPPQDLREEVPEWQRLVVGDVVCLVGGAHE